MKPFYIFIAAFAVLLIVFFVFMKTAPKQTPAATSSTSQTATGGGIVGGLNNLNAGGLPTDSTTLDGSLGTGQTGGITNGLGY